MLGQVGVVEFGAKLGWASAPQVEGLERLEPSEGLAESSGAARTDVVIAGKLVLEL